MIPNKWSQSNQSAKTVLSPNLGIRSWDEVPREQKQLIWRHFISEGWFEQNIQTYQAISQMSEDYKTKPLFNFLLEDRTLHHRGLKIIIRPLSSIPTCCAEATRKDFENIFFYESQDIVYELFSYYVQALSLVTISNDKLVAKFISRFNEISDQFNLNVLLSENGFIPRQDKKIIEDIYEPVLAFLNDKKWEPVNRDLRDAMSAYLKKTDEGYSSSITRTISALEGFMQIIVNGKTGKEMLNDLMKDAQKKQLIPNDTFSRTIFKNIESILMQERQNTGDAHSKKEYANEKTTRLILNLTMIFMQHCLP